MPTRGKVKLGSINETRYQIFPDDMEVTAFCKECLWQCIKEVSGTSVSFETAHLSVNLPMLSLRRMKKYGIKQALPPRN
jgi:hypothetical protein